MKILVACEESQAVTIELRKLGHEAYSCDIEPCSGGHPEWHLQQDVTQLLKIEWDMTITVKIEDLPEFKARLARIKKIMRRRAWVNGHRTGKARKNTWKRA